MSQHEVTSYKVWRRPPDSTSQQGASSLNKMRAHRSCHLDFSNKVWASKHKMILLRLKVMMNQCHCRYIEHSWVGGHDQSSYLGMFLLCLTSSVSTSSISTKLAASSKSSSIAALLDRRINIVSKLHSAHCLKVTQNVAFEFWHFSPIFVLWKLTCLVKLFDRKLQFSKNSPKWTIFD